MEGLMSLYGHFLHFPITNTGIKESLCFLCQQRTGYSKSEDILRIVDKAHKCKAQGSDKQVARLESPRWQYERRLVRVASETWTGWYCERCCWNRRQPEAESERMMLAGRIATEFDTHSCEAFARENWAA